MGTLVQREIKRQKPLHWVRKGLKEGPCKVKANGDVGVKGNNKEHKPDMG